MLMFDPTAIGPECLDGMREATQADLDQLMNERLAFHGLLKALPHSKALVTKDDDWATRWWLLQEQVLKAVAIARDVAKGIVQYDPTFGAWDDPNSKIEWFDAENERDGSPEQDQTIGGFRVVISHQ